MPFGQDPDLKNRGSHDFTASINLQQEVEAFPLGEIKNTLVE